LTNNEKKIRYEDLDIKYDDSDFNYRPLSEIIKILNKVMEDNKDKYPNICLHINREDASWDGEYPGYVEFEFYGWYEETDEEYERRIKDYNDKL
jgi:hypothetical protein